MANQDIANVGTVSSTEASPVRAVLDFFSSIWLGVFLLTMLFVYGSVGSAGFWVPGTYGFTDLHNWVHDIYWMIPWTQFHVRQAPGLEMTEFEWFHWWPFNLLILILCINIIVATVRRIPFNILNLGVWMIHSGIIVLAAGSVIYFATKLEGDAPVARRQVIVNVPGHEPVSFLAMPGNQMNIETDGDELYRFRVMSIDPEWEILSGEHEGEQTYAVSVAVQGPTQQFVRQLLAGFPQYTEDSVRSNDPERPLDRAINVYDTRLVDESIDIRLDYAPQEHFYLMDSTALYIREKGETEWTQRPIQNLPRYNEYVTAETDVFLPEPLREHFQPRPLELAVDPENSSDPLPDVPMYVTHYLRYAAMRTERFEGGDTIDPAVRVRLRSDEGHVETHELVAFDPERSFAAGGRLHLTWAEDEAAFDELTTVQQASLTVRVPEKDIELTLPGRPAQRGEEDFTPIEDTDYEVRIDSLEDNLHIGEAQRVSLAVVTIRTPERTFQRWVFDNPQVRNRDIAITDQPMAMHEAELELDADIEMRYRPANRLAPVTLIAGPGEDALHILLTITGREPVLRTLQPGRPVKLQPNITLEVTQYAARTVTQRRPFVIPPHQREAGDRQQRSMIRVHVPSAIGSQTPETPPESRRGGASVWLPYHLYPFPSETAVMRRFRYAPTEVALDDGRVIELMYARQRRPLPAPVVLEEFILTTHIGGFTGQSTSIRDWTSVVKFQTDDSWTESMHVSMNNPSQFGGFSYFQSQWDPPEPAAAGGEGGEGGVRSRGLNFTVLGVGNRNGVWTQLAGGIIAVIGMMYAFYVKPLLKRRRQQAVYRTLGGSEEASRAFAARCGQDDAMRS